MTMLTQAPGYLEAYTANSSEIKEFKPDETRFHWNLMNRLRHFLKEGEAEARGWRSLVTTIVAERSWEKLLRPDGEPFGTLEALVTEVLDLSVEEFVEEVAKHAGPDMVKLLEPHLAIKCDCNSHDELSSSARRKIDQRKNEAAEAPDFAVRLRAAGFLSQENMQYLGKLSADDAHQETIKLITDQIEDWDYPPATASATVRRRFRDQVHALIQEIAPRPQPQSQVVRLPNDAAKVLRLLQERLDATELQRLRELICSADPSPTTAVTPESRRARNDAMPSPEQALSDVLALAEGELTTGKCVYVLTGQTMKFATFQGQARDGLLNGAHFVEGNGWKFRKLSPDEMTTRGLHSKAASWEVVEYGEA